MPTLTWLTREHDLKTSRNAPYRLLEEVPELSAGTTAAVAHKMVRRSIGIEMGVQAVNLCIPRLQKVIDGETAPYDIKAR